MKKYFLNGRFLLGFVLAALILILTLAGFFLMPFDPLEGNTEQILEGFSARHILGTDHLGRDVLSRLMLAGRISVCTGILVTLFSFLAGTLLGAAGGYFGGAADAVSSKIVDVLMAFPGILLALMLIAIFGSEIPITVLALTLMALPRFARISRSGFIKFKGATFVTASRARGASHLRIILRHILPNISGDLTVTATLTFSMAVLSESGLSYLGLGVQPPYPSFGRMLSDAQRFILTNLGGALAPALCLTILVTGFNLMGDGISQVNRGER